MDDLNIDRFRDFFQGYQDENGRFTYIEQIQRMSLEGLTSLVVDYDDLLRFDPEIAGRLRKDPDLNIDPEITIKEANAALEEVLKIEDRSYVMEAIKRKESFHVRFYNIPTQVDLRRLRAVHLGHFIAIEGIIIRQSIVRPLLVEGRFRCRVCGEPQPPITQEEGIYREPSFCSNPECGKKGPFSLIVEDSIYTDFQSVTVQERPETLPPGQIPRSVPARLVGDVVDAVRAGDRAIVSGILKMKKAEKRGKLATFDPWLDVNFISSREKEFEEIDIDPETEQQIIELSRDLSIHRRIIRSIAPSIYGMEIIKEALATVLFGGVTRETPDGMKQRGDSNILLVGDPGVAKSQLLQFIYRLAPRGLLTSGKASSAAGLTAAVLRDPDTGEFALEAGALVLADRGICAIDEFDKMNPVDRSSIHEAMEQQSYHPSFEISFLNGHKQRIDSFVDDLFTNHKSRKILGKDCEILSVENDGYNVLTTDFKKIFETNVNRVSRHLAPDHFFRITFSNGREIIVTPEHPLFTMKERKITTIGAKEATEKMFVPGIRQLDHRNSSSLATDFSRGRKEITLPDTITSNLAKFLGYYVAEGYSYEGSSLEVGLSNTDSIIVEDMINCIRNSFDIDPMNYVEKNNTIRIISIDIYNYLHENFPETMKKSYEKRIDKKIFCIEKNMKIEFLRAAFAGDGSVESTSIAYSTSSKGLAYDYQDLLLTLGIHSRITSEVYSFGKDLEQKRTRYKVYITGDSLAKFSSQVIEEQKPNPKLMEMLLRSKKSNRKHDVLPPNVAAIIIDALHDLGLSYNGYFYQHIKNNFGITVEVINKYYIDLTNRLNLLQNKIDEIKIPAELRLVFGYSISKLSKLIGISRGTLTKYERANKSDLIQKYRQVMESQLEKVRNSLEELDYLREFRWLRIKKVEKILNEDEYATKWVYDVTIEPTENFISHGLVLHNTVSIAKAGIVAQLNARTAIIAAANPRFGRYEDTRPPTENINLPPTILSRFDLLFVIKDEPNEEVDRKMARHILELRRGHVIEDTEPVITQDLLRKYISYAKQHVQPALTDRAMERIEEYYLDLRKTTDETSAIAITPRYLEAIIRLSESQARMALKEDVTIDHVEAAINLLERSLEQVAKDPLTGKVDIDVFLSGTTKNMRTKMSTIIDIIKEESMKSSTDVVSVQKLKDIAREQNIEDDFVDRLIEQLKKSGDIYSPRDGFVRLV